MKLILNKHVIKLILNKHVIKLILMDINDYANYKKMKKCEYNIIIENKHGSPIMQIIIRYRILKL